MDCLWKGGSQEHITVIVTVSLSIKFFCIHRPLNTIGTKVLGSWLYFYIHLLYYRQFLHCVLSKETLLSDLILGFILSDYIIFHGDISFILSSRYSQLPIRCLPPQMISKNGIFQYLGTWWIVISILFWHNTLNHYRKFKEAAVAMLNFMHRA